MKKTLFIITIVVILIIFTTVIIYINMQNSRNQDTDLGNQEDEADVYNNEETAFETPQENIYVDDNPIKIRLYVKQNTAKKLITEYTSNWDAENIMGIFYAIATDTDMIYGSSYGNVWNEYWNKYQNIQKYRVGYNIKFTLNSGEVIDQIILNPDDAYKMYPKLQFYLYDDIHLVPGKPYYHVTHDAMNENTQFTSVKLVGDKNTKDITTPIELTVFTYDGDEDFDPITSKYRGNSYYTILLNRK